MTRRRSELQTARFEWVDISKAFAIMLVVLLHTRIELAYIGVNAGWVDVLLGAFAHTPMPLFFALSGLFAGKWLRAPWRSILSRKVAPLLWVFLIWQPIVLAYKLLETLALPNQPDNSVVSQLGKFAVTLIRPNGELWFLWALCVFYLLARLLSSLPRLIQLSIAVAASITWSGFMFAALPDSLARVIGNGWAGIFLYFVFFLVAAQFGDSILTFISHSSRWILLLIVIVSIAGTVFSGNLSVRPPGLVFLLQSLAVVGGFAIGRLFSFAGSPVSAIGRGTLQIYLAHTFFLAVFVVIVYYSPFLGVARAMPEVTALVAVALAVSLSWCLHALLVRGRPGIYAYEAPLWFTRVPELRPKH